MERIKVEFWNDIPGYEGLYKISNEGLIRSKEWKVVKPEKNGGYLRVVLSKKGITKHHLVHRLVWTAFVGEIPIDKQINHINEDKTDNRLCNLNLMTAKENVNYGSRNRKASESLKGRKHTYEHTLKVAIKHSKPVIQYDLNGNIINEFNSANEAQRITGIKSTQINSCCNGQYGFRTAGGFIWKRKN